MVKSRVNISNDVRVNKNGKRKLNKNKNHVYEYEGYNSDLSETEEFMEEYAEQTDDDDFDAPSYIFPGLVISSKKSNYILIYNLDGGNNGCVWLSYCIDDKKYFIIKVQDFDCYKGGVVEKKILQYIKNRANEDSHVVELLDYFLYTVEEVSTDDDKKKYHFMCTVYEVYAGSLLYLITNGKYKYGLPIDIVKDITKQLLKSLRFLHDDLHVLHTDIKPANILFEGIHPFTEKLIESFEGTNFDIRYSDILAKGKYTKTSLADKLQDLARKCVKAVFKTMHLGETDEVSDDEEFSDDEDFCDDEKNAEEENDEEENDDLSPKRLNRREQSVEDLSTVFMDNEIVDVDRNYDWDEVLNNSAASKDKVNVVDEEYVKNCKIALADFGSSTRFDDRPKDEIQDRDFRAPEVVLDMPYDFAVDIWSVGCVVFQLLTGFILFEFKHNDLNKDLNTLYMFEKILGPIPLEMKKNCVRSRFLFDEERNHHIRNIKEFKHTSMKDILIKQYLFSEKDADEICEFILPTLNYMPSDRPTAEQLLNHKWLNN